jgi:hypothetical protein
MQLVQRKIRVVKIGKKVFGSENKREGMENSRVKVTLISHILFI